jgi:sulfoxide reductase catalytic subunit YedY
MRIIRRAGWELPERMVTNEHLALHRRAVLAGAAGAAILPAASAKADAPGADAAAAGVPGPDAAADVPVDTRYPPGRAVTPEKDATTYNNYYEFGESKNIWRDAQALKMRPWTIRFEGMVKQPQTLGIDDLLKKVSLEERIYRHRCVEAWAMTVPWTGFPLSQLLKIAEPLGSARYVVFTTAQDKVMSGLDAPFYPWPYVDGLTIKEAANDLAFISTGMYGKPLPPQNGGPIRLTVPWKYGFKSSKAFVSVRFTDKQPQTFWETIQPTEYGFWANVNPEVPHPRWSQATERLLGSNERVPTQIYNGYGEYVASLYTNMKNEQLFR